MTANARPPAETANAERLRGTFAKFMTLGRIKYNTTNYALIVTHETLEYVIGCFICERISSNPSDVMYRYCSHCKVFHETG